MKKYIKTNVCDVREQTRILPECSPGEEKSGLNSIKQTASSTSALTAAGPLLVQSSTAGKSKDKKAKQK
ncbi:MAG: hypothetical protein CSA31_00505 [Desulfobulbus propionicus]|nr:MAG: hypothetical protein CSA31_00505 [Desulfobulbus propionicus]